MTGPMSVAHRTLTRDLPNGSRIVATLRIDRIGGNAHPHFSATGEVYERHGTWSGAAQQRNGREPDMGGAIHSEILRAFPRVAPFVAMHLSDYPSGRPMHAEANARYWWRDSDLSGAARTLRCDVAELPDPSTTSDEAFAAFVEAQAERWAREAREAYDLLTSLPE